MGALLDAAVHSIGRSSGAIGTAFVVVRDVLPHLGVRRRAESVAISSPLRRRGTPLPGTEGPSYGTRLARALAQPTAAPAAISRRR
jgi:hypothetical protein